MFHLVALLHVLHHGRVLVARDAARLVLGLAHLVRNLPVARRAGPIRGEHGVT